MSHRLLTIAVVLAAASALFIWCSVKSDEREALRVYRAFYDADVMFGGKYDIYGDSDFALPQCERVNAMGAWYTLIPIRSKAEVIGSVDPELVRRSRLVFVVLGHNVDSNSDLAPFTAIPKLRVLSVTRAFHLDHWFKTVRVDGEWMSALYPE